MNKLNIIVCTDKNQGIGKNNEIPWLLKKDMLWFKKMTINKTVIMGSNTFRSLKNTPLRDRMNIIVTKNKSFKKYEKTYDNLKIFSSIEKAISFSELNGNIFKETFIIGGGIVYDYVIRNLSHKIHRIYHTLINKDFNCDVKFNHFDKFKRVYESEDIKEKDMEFKILCLCVK